MSGVSNCLTRAGASYKRRHVILVEIIGGDSIGCCPSDEGFGDSSLLAKRALGVPSVTKVLKERFDLIADQAL